MMNNSDFALDAYLERIGLGSMISCSEEGLETLHRAQVYAIPFENFDIILGRGVNLDPQVLYRKLVLQHRGGYCFELNGLFLRALLRIGFNARALLARVHRQGEPGGRTHQLIMVTVNDRDWIADVGFGSNGLRTPIPFELDRISVQDGHRYRLADGGPYGTMLQWELHGDWQKLYSFDLGYVSQADIEMSNYYTSTHPTCFFTWARVANLPRRTGRVSLMNFTLTEIAGEAVRETRLEAGPAYLEALEQYFGIRLDTGYDALQPVTAEHK